MSGGMLISILAAAVSSGTPVLFAALGELVCERAGVLNLGVEGMMLVGAVSGFLATVRTGNIWVGVMAAVAAGGLMGLIHAFMSISLRVNQVVSGLALTLFGTGVSGFLGKSVIGVPLPAQFRAVAIPGLSSIPVLGPILFRHDLMVYLTFILVPALWYLLYRTRPGLHLRAVGESPQTADALGVNVFAIRYVSVIAGGMLAGLGGAYLSMAYAPSWIESMTAGRGWIAVALVIFAVWDPVRAMIGSYLFGGVDALGFRIQVMGSGVSSFFLKMLPYVFTIAVLIIVTATASKRSSRAPEALGLPYERE
ncbi:MAG: ABC transporter permease [Clostridia bacterium]|nr:ABC transporter permease [Clostridia bacterium]